MARAEISSGAAARRKLRFETIEDALSEADRLVAAEREGRQRRVGNWTLGQSLGHLATWAEFAFDGYPTSIQAPLLVRMIVKLLKGRILRGGMMAGVRIRGVPEGTLGTEMVPTDEGLRRFRESFLRLRDECPVLVNPMFGRLTHGEWVQLNLRHAELHLGFLLPE